MTTVEEVRGLWDEMLDKIFEVSDAAHEALVDKGYDTEVELEQLKAIQEVCFQLRELVDGK